MQAEIDQARTMLEQMDATQGEIGGTIKVNRSGTRAQEYVTKLESQIEDMTQEQKQNLEQKVKEGGEELVTNIEDYAGKIAKGTI